MGYHRAGFEVVGVDVNPQPHYPFEFHQVDALEWSDWNFAAVHASPPCQRYSVTRNLTSAKGGDHPDLLAATRDMLIRSGLPYVIENVVGAPLVNPIRLCGSSFGLDVRRHRLFESNRELMGPPCMHGWQTPKFVTQRGRGHKSQQRLTGIVNVSGHDSSFYESGVVQVQGHSTSYLAGVVQVQGSSGGKGGVELWRKAMGIDWMVRDELSQAIPPAFTELIGNQLKEGIEKP